MKIIDGKIIKSEILAQLKEEVSKLVLKPHLVVIQVGDNAASNTYIMKKRQMAEYVGYDFTLLKYQEDVTEEELLAKISELNNDDNVHGILIQMPLPANLDTLKIQNAVLPIKDVDGLTDINGGMLFHNKNALYPCTPSGIMELLRRYNISVVSKHVVVVGRSNLVGKPMATMLINAGATVTVCHSKTQELAKYTQMADILIVAVGKPNLITSDMVKEEAIVIDVGISSLNDKLCGDVDFMGVSSKVAYITPVPGGVGPMTVSMLASNVLKAYKLQKGM